jgi:hypothetical protein
MWAARMSERTCPQDDLDAYDSGMPECRIYLDPLGARWGIRMI